MKRKNAAYRILALCLTVCMVWLSADDTISGAEKPHMEARRHFG